MGISKDWGLLALARCDNDVNRAARFCIENDMAALMRAEDGKDSIAGNNDHPPFKPNQIMRYVQRSQTTHAPYAIDARDGAVHRGAREQQLPRLPVPLYGRVSEAPPPRALVQSHAFTGEIG